MPNELVRQLLWPAKKLPGYLNAYRQFLDLREKVRPYRWRRTSLRQWLSELDQVSGQTVLKNPRRVLFFCVLPWWVNISLATAVALAGCGCVVDLVWLPYSNFGPRGASFWEKYSLWVGRSFHGVVHRRLCLRNLSNMKPSELTEAQEEEVKKQARVDTQYVGRKEEINIESNPSDREIYRFRLARDRNCMAALVSLLGEQRYDAMIVANGAILEMGIAYRLAKLEHLPCITFEYFDKRGFAGVSDEGPCTELNTDDAWQADEPHVLTEGRIRRVMQLIAAKEGGNWEEFTLRLHHMPRSTAADLIDGLNLKPDRPIALMCPNVAWDSSTMGRNKAFASMAEWVRITVDYFARHPSGQLVVRAHPAERALGTSQPVDEIIREHCKELPDNIRLILPEDVVNTYSLMDIADLGLVYTSTAGMEMAARGLPVIVSADTHYCNRGFTVDPTTVESYYVALNEAIMNPSKQKLTDRQIELAYCYIDVFYDQWPKPFPWNLETLKQDIVEWPISRILSKEGLEKFGATFDSLAGRKDKYPGDQL